VDVYNPNALSARLRAANQLPSGLPDPHITTTRRKYARIRVVDTGVLTPTPGGLLSNTTTTRPVPFNLILEPLFLGILPASVVPVLLFSLPILLLAGLAIPRAIAYLERLADSARQEIKDRQKVE
jgi:hypothetical protein